MDLGNKAVRSLQEKKNEIKRKIKDTFRNDMYELTEKFDNNSDPLMAPQLSSQLFQKAELFISAVQNIELSLHNFERELYKYKMAIYKDNNEGRAKMDASVSLHPWGYSSQSYSDGSVVY